jgi:hypothetical protein
MLRYIVVFHLVSFTACYYTPGAPKISVDAGPTFEECKMASGNLPFSRNTVYAAGSQVQSVDLNEMQDVDIANIGDLILGLGGSSGAPYTTLADLIQQGTFTPVFNASPSPAFDYDTAEGCYQRIGDVVSGVVKMTWENTDATFDATELEIVPPYEPAASEILFNGSINYSTSNFDTQSSEFTTGSPVMESGMIKIRGRNTTLNSTGTVLLYGGGPRSVTFSYMYRTNGVYSY